MTTDDPLIETIADAIVDADTLTGDLMPTARKVYAAITATGRLLPEEGKVGEEWGVRGVVGHVTRCAGRAEADTLLDYHRERGWEAELVTHTHWQAGATDWEAVDDHA